MAENEELQEEMSEGETRQKILVADDEASIRRILETRLKMVGYDVVTAEDGEEAVEVFNKTNPDLVVLDVMMPKMDGYGVTREIRRTSDVPIIILTALGDVSERITGLELGADDYVIKPFSPKELEARVKAVLRRCEPKIQKKVSSVGPLSLDTGNHSVTVNGEPVKLTLKEYEVLYLLLQEPGKVYSREDLMKAIWGISNIGETRTVDVHIATLRTKIGVAAPLIETVRGVGYRASEKK